MAYQHVDQKQRDMLDALLLSHLEGSGYKRAADAFKADAAHALARQPASRQRLL